MCCVTTVASPCNTQLATARQSLPFGVVRQLGRGLALLLYSRGVFVLQCSASCPATQLVASMQPASFGMAGRLARGSTPPGTSVPGSVDSPAQLGA